MHRCSYRMATGLMFHMPLFERLPTGGHKIIAYACCRVCGRLLKLYGVCNPAKVLRQELVLRAGEEQGERSFVGNEVSELCERFGLVINTEGVLDERSRNRVERVCAKNASSEPEGIPGDGAGDCANPPPADV